MKTCLNCSEPLSKNFCANCGQKTDTHRITITHFVAHDLIHGVWHFDKGMLFTLGQAVKRPGKAALDYIGGKRVRYYNVFYLTLLLIGLNLLLNHFYNTIFPNPEPVPADGIAVSQFIEKNVKFILISIIPVMAIAGWLVFRRLKFNLAEHFIVGGIALLGMMLMSLLAFFLDFINSSEYYTHATGALEVAAYMAFLLYPVWTYSNAVHRLYSVPGFLWRIVVFSLLFYSSLILLLYRLVVWAGDGIGTLYFNL